MLVTAAAENFHTSCILHKVLKMIKYIKELTGMSLAEWAVKARDKACQTFSEEMSHTDDTETFFVFIF